MIGLQPLLAFAETAKRGNFAQASRELGCSPSSLAKAVRRLEALLGVRLFHRTTRSVTLTDDGRRLFARCQRVLAELELLQNEASGVSAEPSGTLRIDMPVALGRLVVLPLLAQLAERYPQVSIDARLTDRYVDLIKEGIDVAIRTGTLDDSSLVARPFGQQEIVLVGAPSYVARVGMPRDISDLAKHTAVLFRIPSTGKLRQLQLRSRDREVRVLPQSRICVDDGDAIVRAAILGMGIGQVPHYMVVEPIARGELVELLPSLRPAASPIAAVMPTARLVPARVRVFLDLVASSARAIPEAPRVPAALRSARRTPHRARMAP
jgi:DNA-binding transcriptional LysR family regulator